MFFSFDQSDAVKYGVNEAIVLAKIKHFVLWAKSNNQNIHEGRHWTYNSMKAWSKYFQFLTERQCRIAIESLIRQNVILKAKPNSSKWDHKTWVTLNAEESLCAENKLYENIGIDEIYQEELTKTSGQDSTAKLSRLDANVESSICTISHSNNTVAKTRPNNNNTHVKDFELGFNPDIDSVREYLLDKYELTFKRAVLVKILERFKKIELLQSWIEEFISDEVLVNKTKQQIKNILADKILTVVGLR